MYRTRNKKMFISNAKLKNKKTSVSTYENGHNFKKLYEFYLKLSSIHGLGHVVEKGRGKEERVFWVLIVVIAVFGTVYSSHSTWQRFQNNPTVISLERDYKEWNTTFPAVTVCPFNKINKSAVQRVMDLLISENRRTEFQQFLSELASATFRTFYQVSDFNDLSPNLYRDLILNTSFKLEMEEATSNLAGFDENVNLFEPVMLELGLCYTINSVIVNNYGVIPGLKTRDQMNRVMRKAFVGDALSGDVFLQIINMNSGGTVYVHNHIELPDVVSHTSILSELHFRTIDLSAISIVSSDEISYLSVEQRKCRFLHESELSISSIYTYNLCQMNCRMELSHHLCSCIPYFYWSIDSSKYKVCNTTGMQCLARNKDKLLNIGGGMTDGENACVCLPACDDTNYPAERIFSLEWHMGTNLKWGIVKYPRIRFRRDILFGITDLLVAIGGSAALFLGCSVLSFIEIIYYWLILPLFMCARLAITNLCVYFNKYKM